MSNVNHPTHYNQEGKKECIVEMQEMFGTLAVILFCCLNMYKYLYRDGHKEGATEDKKKARWYSTYAWNLIIGSNFYYYFVRICFPRIYNYIDKTNV